MYKTDFLMRISYFDTSLFVIFASIFFGACFVIYKNGFLGKRAKKQRDFSFSIIVIISYFSLLKILEMNYLQSDVTDFILGVLSLVGFIFLLITLFLITLFLIDDNLEPPTP